MNPSTKWYRENKHRPEVREAWNKRDQEWRANNREKWLADSRKRQRKYRERNPEKAKQSNERSRYKRWGRNKEFGNAYKNFFGCRDCGERDPVVLDFHHRNEHQKNFTVSHWAFRASLVTLTKEFWKCDVLCANCHRREHAKRIGEHEQWK